MSDVLPRFDPESRATRLRLELDNPNLELQPDMFVDVELGLRRPPALTVPSDAILDSGLQHIVFVATGEDRFVPRSVRTGWRSADRVAITHGLSEGDRVVISGQFLMNAESRLHARADRERIESSAVAGARR